MAPFAEPSCGGGAPLVVAPRRRRGYSSGAAVRRTVTDMKKRVLSAFLWFYCGWYAGAMIASIIGVSPMLGPIVGAAAAMLIAGDPRGIIWPRKAAEPAATASAPATAPVSA
jgi:hypothetical protein